MPEIVCISNNERSKPPGLVKKSKYLTINKHGNIALFTIRLPNSIYMHSINNLYSLYNKTFNDFGDLCHLCT